MQYHPIPENRQRPAASLILLANLSFPTLRKALEKLLTQRLTYLMESCNITSRNQHVFLEGRSVDTAIHSLINRIADAKRLSKHVLVLSSDIKGAFDNLQYQAIINSLIRSGSPDNIVLIFISLLQNWLVTMQTPREKSLKNRPRADRSGHVADRPCGSSWPTTSLHSIGQTKFSSKPPLTSSTW
ncbi:hypothetical protein AVEN_126493-1 [Araneus ventricosus]|uniref:Uncharacterized protein n=1 Tax=Araneus ventricosus TaxID=182803 RepID=A0A4Y2X2S2_ARAVE|nr:hypothetical protein AVEN_126493-1 [Araneus ventricosus]